MTSSNDQRRDRNCELGYLQRADGSCLYSFGGTVVLASVNGPGDLRQTRQLSERASVEANFHTKVGGSMTSSVNDSATNRSVSRHLRTVCESCLITKLFPRSSIVITVQEMHDNGGLAAAAINATCLAILDAGLPMRTVFAAVTCILYSTENQQEVLLVEPNSNRERAKNVRAKILFVFESGGDQETNEDEMDEQQEYTSSLALCSMEGVMTSTQLKTAQDAAYQASLDVFRLYRTVVKKKFSRRVEFVDRHGLAMVEK